MSRILVVDNDSGLRGLLVLAFEGSGAEVIAAADAEEADAALRAGGIGALLMDVHLGAGRRGPELLRAWHAEGLLPPTWLVTGTPDDPEVCALALPPLQRVVAKPFALIPLVREVQGAVEPVR